ncbi:hypothetical protein PUN28_000560 [Cardiocondyla obscurior]|uniref:Uncharacterized protein n=1 Tax=Cardiocondyla obscurior TaxID=286306 RepID=A0AAW2H024_9HYME
MNGFPRILLLREKIDGDTLMYKAARNQSARLCGNKILITSHRRTLNTTLREREDQSGSRAMCVRCWINGTECRVIIDCNRARRVSIKFRRQPSENVPYKAADVARERRAGNYVSGRPFVRLQSAAVGILRETDGFFGRQVQTRGKADRARAQGQEKGSGRNRRKKGRGSLATGSRTEHRGLEKSWSRRIHPTFVFI